MNNYLRLRSSLDEAIERAQLEWLEVFADELSTEERNRLQGLVFKAIEDSHWEDLEKQSEWLDCLEAAGVDNWRDIDLAYEIRDNN